MAGMNTASNPGSPALDSFLEKWRTRWPEWQVAEVFVPASQRELAVAWFALIQEFEDVMNASGDTTPADAKLAWWGEELRDWSRRRSRHPLGRLLEPHAAPWFALAEQLPVLQRLRERPGDAQAVLNAVQPLASGLAEVECVLFGGTSAVAATDIATQLLAARLFAGGGGVVPSGHGEASWAAALLQRWPRKPAGGKPRRIWSALARTRLGRLQPGASGIRPPSLPRILWLSWKAAR